MAKATRKGELPCCEGLIEGSMQHKPRQSQSRFGFRGTRLREIRRLYAGGNIEGQAEQRSVGQGDLPICISSEERVISGSECEARALRACQVLARPVSYQEPWN